MLFKALDFVILSLKFLFLFLDGVIISTRNILTRLCKAMKSDVFFYYAERARKRGFFKKSVFKAELALKMLKNFSQEFSYYCCKAFIFGKCFSNRACEKRYCRGL